VHELPLHDGRVRDQRAVLPQQRVEPAERVLDVLVREVPVERVDEERVQLVELWRGEVGRVDDGEQRYDSACSSTIASTSSRIAIPSSTSSRVIVSGGTTMITFQCVIR
jgi:hypothetical protein